MAALVDEESLPIRSLCRLDVSHSPLSHSSALVFFLFFSSMWLPTVYIALYPVVDPGLHFHSKEIATTAVTSLLHNRQQSLQKKNPKVVHHFCLPPKKTHTCTEIQAALVQFLSSAIPSGTALLKSLENERHLIPARRLQAAWRQCSNTRAIRHCLPFSLGDIEYISRLNLIRNTAE